LNVRAPDFATRANACGVHGRRPFPAEEYAPLQKRCPDTPGVHLIEVPIDYSDNDRIFNFKIKELSAKV